MKETKKKIRKNIKESLKLTTLGFTLVELLAVIVILAIILVIAVPKVMSVIEDSKKATLESTAKMIASAAEKTKIQNTVLGNTEEITCDSVAKINKLDYVNCNIEFDNNTAKVTIEGSGKFENLWICHATKTNAFVTDDKCPISFVDDDWETIVKAVQSGNYPYQVGDTKEVDLGELGVHTLRVANTTPCDGTLASETACGFVLEFAKKVSYHHMNDTSTNIGGWPASKMRAYVNGKVYNSLPKELRNGIIDTYVVSSHGENDIGTREDGNFESVDKLYLLSQQEVYGVDKDSYDSSIGTSRQLDYYANNNVSMTNYSDAIKKAGSESNWWLRSKRIWSDTTFDIVGANGELVTSYGAISTKGCSPAFRIG